MNKNPSHCESIKTLQSIARSAGEIVHEGFHAPKQITHKGTVDLVTQYDVATERFIIDQLRTAFPQHTLIGEESHQGSLSEVPEYAIYIDPIDGTTNFVHGIPHVAISIGVYEHCVGTMGVVYNPMLDEMFWAVQGQGAFLNDAPIHTGTQEVLQQALVATGFPYSKVTRGAEFQWVMRAMNQMLPSVRDIRRLGSAALDLCYVARGVMDAYYEIALKPWDYAAGAIIAREAGAVVSTILDVPIAFSDNTIVAANPTLHPQIIAQLAAIRLQQDLQQK